MFAQTVRTVSTTEVQSLLQLQICNQSTNFLCNQSPPNCNQMLKALLNAIIVFPTFIVIMCTSIQLVWTTLPILVLVYLHGSIYPCVHNPDRVAKIDRPLSRHFRRVYVCIFAKIESLTWQTSCAVSSVQFSLSKFTVTTRLMSWFKFVLF